MNSFIILNTAASSLQTVERHDAEMHSPMREGQRMEASEEIASKEWKAVCLSVEGYNAGKPEAVKCPHSWKFFTLLSELVANKR